MKNRISLSITRKKIIYTTIFLVTTLYILLIQRPQHIVLVAAFIASFSGLVFSLLYFAVPRIYALVGMIGSILFLTISYFVGFQILNTILLASVIIGIVTLLHRR